MSTSSTSAQPSTSTSTRRRGAALEAAILEAAWNQLVDAGYERFSFDTVSQRAQTGKSVLYRRWSSRRELLRASVRHHGLTRPGLAFPDTGSIREDLLAYLAAADEQRVEEMVLLSGIFAGRHDGPEDLSPEDIRRDLLGDRTTGIETIVERAIRRGEIDGDRVTPRVATLAFDLFRLEVMTTLARVPDHVRRQIVDDIFLPLVTPVRDSS